MSSIADSAAFARLLARASNADALLASLRAAGAAEAVGAIPTDAEIDAAAEAQIAGQFAGVFGGNRHGRRATRAVDSRSERPAATPPAAKTKAQAAAQALERSQDRRYRQALERRSADWTEAPTKTVRGRPWRTIPQVVWVMSKDVVSDTSGRAWRYWARQIRNKAALGAIRRAALLPAADGVTTRRSWSDECARRIAALGLALVQLAKHTSRKGPFCLIVRGISINALRWLLGYPVSSSIRGAAAREAAAKLPFYTTLIGRHRGRDSSRERGTLGYLRCLEETGLIALTQQAYTDPAPWELSDVVIRPGHPPRRYNMNRYWVTGDAPSTRSKTRKPELVELNREGWRSLDERPRRQRSRVLYTKKPAESGPPAAPS